MSQQTHITSKVVTQALSSINFSHNQYANRLPLATGILYFGMGAQRTLFRYGSRIGLTVSYSTTYTNLSKLGVEGKSALQKIGRDPERALILRADNVQTTHKQRQMCIGRENQVLHGTAAIAVEIIGLHDPAVLDVESKQRHVEKGLRNELTVAKLLDMIDFSHIDTIGGLHWLATLVNYVPELALYKHAVTNLFRSEGAKRRPVSPHRSNVIPLSTNAKNETLLVELKDALLDFFAQMGQTKETYQHNRIWFAGGDGLTFEKILQLKNTLQFEDLAHAINQYSPNIRDILGLNNPHFLRIEFGSEDILARFAGLNTADAIPSFDDLRARAIQLNRCYSSLRAYHRAMEAHDPSNPLSVPLGKEWEEPAKSAFKGDAALAELTCFMWDAHLVRDVAQAVAEMDILKVRFVTVHALSFCDDPVP
ncbi:hypothetical protein OF83DRAFT_1159117 [Amylostereum chailletii]|nr:hypothetical protein OF83DRAFT_1159117 [Amylostereum chailletii]